MYLYVDDSRVGTYHSFIHVTSYYHVFAPTEIIHIHNIIVIYYYL